MIKHSPGPWRWVPRTAGETLVDADGNIITRGTWPHVNEDNPDARLIAAAPELYSLLEIVAAPLHINGDDHAAVVKQARDLIRRIEGEECPHQRIVTQDVIPEVSTCLDCRKEWTK